MGERADSVGNVELVKLVGLCVQNYFTEPLKHYLIVIIEGVKIPEVATRRVAGDRWLSK